MKDLKTKIILDTNIFISFLITNNFQKIDEIIFSENLSMLVSERLISEFLNVVKRPKFKKYFSNEDINKMMKIIINHGIFVEVISEINVCRDEKDNFLLSLSKDGKADFLITGDEDLLILGKFENTKIIKLSDFLDLF